MHMRAIYREIARRYRVPVAEVRSEMRKAIELAWRNPDKTAPQAALQGEVPCAGEIPTPEEIISYARKKAR